MRAQANNAISDRFSKPAYSLFSIFYPMVIRKGEPVLH